MDGVVRRLRIGDNDRLAGLKDRDDGVGGTEIDTYCFGHFGGPPWPGMAE